MGRSAAEEDDAGSEKDMLSRNIDSGITKTVIHQVTSAERSDGVQPPNKTYST